MASVWETRFAEIVRRLAGMRESTALELLPDLMPVLPLIDPAAPELALLRRERLGSGRVDVTAVAGQSAFLKVHNPVGSGLIVTVRRVSAYAAAATLISSGLVVTGSATGSEGGKGYRDARGLTLSTAAPTTKLLYGTSVAHPTLVQSAQPIPIATETELATAVPYVLSPGSQLYLAASVVNTTVAFNVMFTERVCDPTELQPSGA